MRIALSILINVLLAGLLGCWLRSEWHQANPRLRRWLLPALGWRVLLTAISSAYPSPDLLGPVAWGRLLATSFWEDPRQIGPMLQGASFHMQGHVASFYQWSNTLFFYKVLAVCSMFSGGSSWFNGLYLSMLCFMASWSLVRVLSEVFPLAPAGAAGVAFLAWPSVLWWTAGLTKETLVVGAGAGVAALALTLTYQKWPARRWRLAGRVALGLLLAWVMFRIRYFFALPLLGGLLALAAVRGATRRGWLGASAGPQVGGVLLGLALLAGPVLVAGRRVVSAQFLVDEIGRNYAAGLRASVGRPHLEYADWQATPPGLLRHLPQAVGQVLARPWLGESARPQYVAVALENLVLLALLGLALLAAVRGRAGHLPVALVAVLLLYCLLLAAFIGLSTPNLGTLSRYRAALLPWLLLLLLQNDYARGLLRKLGR
jgi:hypothetical protein